MTYDKVKLLKQNNKQFGRKAVRILQLNLRFAILLSLLLITVLLFVHLDRTLYNQPKHLSLHQFVRSFFNDPYQLPLKTALQANISDDDENFDFGEFELIWSNEAVELFQDQLGIIIEDDGDKFKSLKCHPGVEFIVSALPGPNDDNLSDNLWQYLSLIALQSQTIQYDDEGKKLSMKGFVTEQMRAKLNELLDG